MRFGTKTILPHASRCDPAFDMKILVTGAAGFIASHFGRILRRERPDVDFVILDALELVVE